MIDYLNGLHGQQSTATNKWDEPFFLDKEMIFVNCSDIAGKRHPMLTGSIFVTGILKTDVYFSMSVLYCDFRIERLLAYK